MYAHQELGKFRFRPFKAISRAVHITPTSFQPKKILGAIGSITATTLTAGFGPLIAPKVFSANSETMKSIGIATTAIAIVAGAVVLGPAIAASLGPTLTKAGDLAGKGVDQLTGFMGAFNKLSPASQQQHAGQLTPQQIADIESGRALLTENGVVYPQGSTQPPGSLMVQGQPVPDGYGSSVAPAEAGILSGLAGFSPMTLAMLVGVPVLFMVFNRSNGKR